MNMHLHPKLCSLALTMVIVAGTVSAQRGPRRFQRPEAAAPAPTTPEEKPAAKKKVEHWVAIRGGDLYIGDGTVRRRTTLLIGDDTITAIGNDLELPEGCEIVDASGKVVTPGFCIAKASGFGTASAGTDVREELNPFDPTIKLGLAAGITSFLWQSGGGSSGPGGHSALVKLAYGDLDGMVEVVDPVASMRVPLSPGDLASLRDLVKQAREHLAAIKQKSAEEAAKTKPPKGTEEILKVLSGEKRLWIGAGGGGLRRGRGDFDVATIRQAMEVAELLGVGVVLDGPIEGWLVADEIAATGSMAVVAPRVRVAADDGRPDESGSNLAQCAILAASGVPVTVTPPGGRFGGPSVGTGGILGQDLNTPSIDAAFAIRGGMPDRLALRTLTLDAAKIAHAEARVGSLEVGKDADVLILDGDPLNYKTFVEVAFVNGKVVYRKDQEPYYRHIRRRETAETKPESTKPESTKPEPTQRGTTERPAGR